MRLKTAISIALCTYLATATPVILSSIRRFEGTVVGHAYKRMEMTRTSPLATNTSSAPAPTMSVSGCTSYYVVEPGQTCTEVAQMFGADVNTFMAWNPSIIAPTCPNMWAGYGYCVALDQATPALPSPTANHTITISVCSRVPTATPEPGSSATGRCGRNQYVTYSGNGSAAAGWPTMSEWVEFDCMFRANTPIMRTSCSQWGVAQDSNVEIAGIKNAIKAVSASNGLDPRFVLAIIMQESQGCARVISTYGSVRNPGLMQSHNGTGTCNSNGVVQTPCPYSEIHQMITDGVAGTPSGDGLVQCMQKQGHTDISRWYRTARMYNGGSIQDPQNLDQGCCTASYASDIANRLLGWTTAPRNFMN